MSADDRDSQSPSEREPPPSADNTEDSSMFWLPALITTAAVGLAFQFGFAPERIGTHTPMIALGLVYVALAIPGLLRLRRRDELYLVKPRGGDLTFGALVAALLYGLAFAFHAVYTSPGRAGHGWIVRIYLILGDPFADTRLLLGLGAAVVGLLEEFVWRGWVTPTLEEKLGQLRGSVAGALVYGLAHVPTIWVLRDAFVGLNPLLVIASLGCGAAWTYLRFRMVRLPPVLFSHALFTWAIVEFPLFR
ncbi:MAG: type II CAAX endopeptidase family protein [Polyangiaceae bacterium]